MPKTLTQFVCQQCGNTQAKWSGKCLNCGGWNTLVEERVVSGATKSKAARLRPDKLSEIDTTARSRVVTGIGDFDQVLGGGIVPGSVMLLSGDPGIGKSTIVLQLAAILSAKQKILYVSGEESGSQIKLRAERLGLGATALDLLAETNVDDIAATVEIGDYALVVIDSIQTMFSQTQSSAPGTLGQVTASAQILQQSAKRTHTAILIIGHVTKEGSIAGPKILEHLVDVVLYLEGERYGSFKSLRGIKNRFGSTNEVGIFEMTGKGMVPVNNPSEAMLKERHQSPGSIVLPTMEGSRPILVEVQALTSPTIFGYPKRTASGVDLNRLNLLAAVMQKHAGINLNNQDIFVNIVGGLKITEPAADLAIILGIASAFKNAIIKPHLVAFGEVGLSGEIRSVSSIQKRLAEAKKLGFTQAIGPGFANDKGSLMGVKTVADAIRISLEP